jgi:hypothetical protein
VRVSEGERNREREIGREREGERERERTFNKVVVYFSLTFTNCVRINFVNLFGAKAEPLLRR